MTTSRPIITVTRRLPEEVEAKLAEDFEVRLNREDRPLDQAGLGRALAESDGVLCTVTDRLDAVVLGVHPLRARILANYGVGYEHIDVAAAARAGLTVTNTPGVLTDATADLALALMLMVARRCGEGERELRQGRWTGWRPTHLIGADVSGRTLGIIGLGRIGRAVAERAGRGFGMRVLALSRRPVPPDQARALGVLPAGSLPELLQHSDFVSLHCPLVPETRHLMNASTLAMMRPDAFLINTARGAIVDEAALAQALDRGTIAGAGLDVFAEEPQVHPGLLGRENVVLLPHLGSATRSARVAMGMKARDNLAAFFAGRPVPDPVR